MMAERAIGLDHSTVHRWVIKLVPLFEKTFRKHKRPVGKSWRMDESYIKVKGSWRYLYRAVDKAGNTIDFLFRAKRDKAAARRFFEKAIGQNGSPRDSHHRQDRFQSGRASCGEYRARDAHLDSSSQVF
jgi:putative transposase